MSFSHSSSKMNPNDLAHSIIRPLSSMSSSSSDDGFIIGSSSTRNAQSTGDIPQHAESVSLATVVEWARSVHTDATNTHAKATRWIEQFELFSKFFIDNVNIWIGIQKEKEQDDATFKGNIIEGVEGLTETVAKVSSLLEKLDSNVQTLESTLNRIETNQAAQGEHWRQGFEKLEKEISMMRATQRDNTTVELVNGVERQLLKKISELMSTSAAQESISPSQDENTLPRHDYVEVSKVASLTKSTDTSEPVKHKSALNKNKRQAKRSPTQVAKHTTPKTRFISRASHTEIKNELLKKHEKNQVQKRTSRSEFAKQMEKDLRDLNNELDNYQELTGSEEEVDRVGIKSEWQENYELSPAGRQLIPFRKLLDDSMSEDEEVGYKPRMLVKLRFRGRPKVQSHHKDDEPGSLRRGVFGYTPVSTQSFSQNQ